jgi:hypothetical protein
VGDPDGEGIEEEDEGEWRLDLGERDGAGDEGVDDRFVLVGTIWKRGVVIVLQGVIGVVMMVVRAGLLRAVAVVDESEVATGGFEVAGAVVADVHAERLGPEDSQEGGQGKEAMRTF